MGFREDFIWGAATASYQIEGGWNEGGRKPSVWDDFSHTPGKVFEGHTGDVACDHYHRWAEDVEMMSALGLKAYRFSAAWPRIIPDGKGVVNEKGVEFYDRLIDALLEKGIRPFMTLFHWDYPSALQKLGAWENPDSAKWYLDYAEICARRFGDRVKDILTFNEPQCFIGLGYQMGAMAPGLRMLPSEVVPMSHHVLKAHGMAVKMLRELVPGVRVGYAPCGNVGIPATNSPEDIEAARQQYFANDGRGMFSVSWWSDPALLGVYPEDGLKLYGQYLPEGWEKDMETIHQPLDFYCQNIYNGDHVRATKDGGREIVPEPMGHAKTACGWPVTPDALYWGPKFLYERYKTPIIITENGMANTDTVSLSDGQVHDPQRVDYLHRYLREYRRAADDGVDARGYFQWSLMDNYEWANGYAERFGMVYVDYATGKRIPKDSAYWYKTVIASNGESL